VRPAAVGDRLRDAGHAAQGDRGRPAARGKTQPRVRTVLHRVRGWLAGWQRHNGTALRRVHSGTHRICDRRSARLTAAVSSRRPKEYITMKAIFPFVMLVTAGMARAQAP